MLEHYLFRTPTGDHLLVLGVGSLFNHSVHPNLDYRVDAASLVVRFFAVGPIAAGQELTIFYGSNLWFADRTAHAGKQGQSMHEHMDCADAFLAAIEL